MAGYEIPPSFAFAPAVEQLRRLRAGDVTARALLEFHLDRIARFDGALNAVIYSDLPAARARADRADAASARGESWGSLHGLPMTVKEIHNVAGWPTTWGDPARVDDIAERDAVVIARLRGAGAIILGKTNVPLNALDWQSYNAIHGTTRNPWDLGRTPGGSSGGGTAALAAGLVPLELGTDGGGSIRFPAHYCGVYGHKPTPGLVPGDGNQRRGSLLDNDLVVAGPLARSVADLALALDVIVGPAGAGAKAWRLDLPPPRATRLRDFRVAIVTDSPVAEVDERYQDVIRTLMADLRREGAEVTEGALPFTDHAAHHATYLQLLRGSGAAQLADPVFADAIRRADETGSNASPYRVGMARAYTQRHRDWIRAAESRARLQQDWATFFETFDVVVAPTTVSAAFPLEEIRPREERVLRINGRDVDYNDQLFWAGLATLPSLPATAAPIGFVDHLPVGVQVVGPAFEDRTTLAFAAELERLHPFTPPAGY